MQAYCVKCKKKVLMKMPKKHVYDTKNGKRYAFKGKCPRCSTNVTRFATKEDYMKGK